MSAPSLIRSVLANWSAFLFAAITNFALSPFIVRTLGDSQYGTWVLLTSVVAYLGLLDLGVRSAVTRYVARFHGTGQHDEAARVASNALTVFGIAGVAAVTLSAGVAALLGTVFHLPPQFVDIARVAALIGGVSAAVSLISGVFGGILIGLQRFDYDNALEIAVGAVRVVAIVVVLKEGQGLVVLAAVQLGANVLRGMANYWAVRHLYPELRARVRWDAPYLRMILTFGVSVSLLEFVSSVHLYSSALVIGALLPVGAITFYAIGGTLMEGARSVVNGIAWVVTPMASASEGRGDQPGVRAAILGAARFASLAVLPIVVTFLLRGHSFVSLWMGESYSAVSGNVLQVLAVALWPIACYQVITAGMVGVGRLAGLIPILLVEVACILGLSILWVGDFGVIGAAWGSTLPRVVTSVVAGPWYLRRTVGVSLRTFWGTTLLLPSLAMLPFAAASYAMEQLWPAESLVSYFAQVMLSLPLAAAGGWFVCFSRAERVALIQRWRFRLRRGDVDSAG